MAGLEESRTGSHTERAGVEGRHSSIHAEHRIPEAAPGSGDLAVDIHAGCGLSKRNQCARRSRAAGGWPGRSRCSGERRSRIPRHRVVTSFHRRRSSRKGRRDGAAPTGRRKSCSRPHRGSGGWSGRRRASSLLPARSRIWRSNWSRRESPPQQESTANGPGSQSGAQLGTALALSRVDATSGLEAAMSWFSRKCA